MRWMTKPRIVAEARKEPVSRPPPPTENPHEWLSPESLELHDRVSDAGGRFDIYLSRVADGKIREQATRAAPESLEVMGLLLGEVCEWDGRSYVVIRDACTTDLKNTPSKVRFDTDALPKLFRDLDGLGFDYVVVGWYHSHPGHTCFLSRIDLDTQRTIFDQPFHCALVIDPVNTELKVYRLSGRGYVEVPFGMFRDLGPRVRRLKGRG